MNSDEDLDGDGNSYNDDTDGDGVPNLADIDDDNDSLLTSDEFDHTGDGIRALGGYRFNRRFQVGYAFDFSISNQLPLGHLGSHELMLQYKIMTKLDEFALKPKKI